MIICPKCGKTVKEGINVCTSCGTKLYDASSLKKQQQKSAEPSNSVGIGVGILTLISLVIILKVHTIPGMLLYLVALGVAMMELKKDMEITPENFVNCVKNCFQKDRFISKGIPMIVVIILPLMIVFATYTWIITDSIREVDHMYNQLGGY